MIAILTTQDGDYVIPDLEKITGFQVRQGQTFRIDVKDAEAGMDWFTNSDPLLQVTGGPVPDGSKETTATILAANAGTAKLQLRRASDALEKQWLIHVFSDEAADFNVPQQTTEPIE